MMAAYRNMSLQLFFFSFLLRELLTAHALLDILTKMRIFLTFALRPYDCHKSGNI